MQQTSMARKKSAVRGLAKIFEERSESTCPNPGKVRQPNVDNKIRALLREHDSGKQNVNDRESSDTDLARDTPKSEHPSKRKGRKGSIETRDSQSENISLSLRDKKRPSVYGLVKKFEKSEDSTPGEDNEELEPEEPQGRGDPKVVSSHHEDNPTEDSDSEYGTPSLESPRIKSARSSEISEDKAYDAQSHESDRESDGDAEDEFSVSEFCHCAFDVSTQVGDDNSSIEETDLAAKADAKKEECSFCGTPIFIDPDLQSFMDKYESTITCPTCLREWCCYCKAPVHEGLTCAEYLEKGKQEPSLTSQPEPEPTTAPTASAETKGKGAGKKSKQGTLNSGKKLLLKTADCETCLEHQLTWQPLCCNVNMCLTCLDLYISSKVEQGIIDIQCPGHSCETLLDPSMIKSVVVNEKSKRLSFLRVKSNRYKNRKACPICDFVLSMDDSVLHFYKEFESIVLCPKCENEWCFHCMVPWHEGLSCGAYKASHTDTGVTAWAGKTKLRTGLYKERNAQKCPNCKIWIERIAGCYFMTCKECKTNFCYDCGIRTPHPSSSSCINSRFGVHGERPRGNSACALL